THADCGMPTHKKKWIKMYSGREQAIWQIFIRRYCNDWKQNERCPKWEHIRLKSIKTGGNDMSQTAEMTPEQIETAKAYMEMGLSEQEYNRVKAMLNRRPNLTETGVFSVMWSEHCSYKTSKALLKRFPIKAPQVLQGPGEGAGIIDIGDGQAVVFKVESHNHPSAVQPYDGAATGVGGILRDIF